MTWVDYSVVLILAVSMLFGVFRGFVREVLGLIGWVAALYLAARFAPIAAELFPQDLGPMGRQLAGGGLIFVVVMVTSGIVAWLIAKAAHSVGLGFVDRALGLLFGLMRGGLIVLVGALMIGLSPVSDSLHWKEARLRGPLETAVIALKPYLPPAVAEKLRFSKR